MELTDLDMLGEGRSGGSVAIIDGLRAEKEQLQADLRVGSFIDCCSLRWSSQSLMHTAV